MMRKSALIVGLGNPGKRYEKTRHNFGFMIIAAFAEKKGWSLKNCRDLNGEIAEGRENETKVVLLRPLTYMNCSSRALLKTLSFYKISIEDFIVISDDVFLEFGSFRYREKGSCGGHNGLRDIEIHLKTQDYQRLRMGVGHVGGELLSSYVLSPFEEEEQKCLPKVIEKSIQFLDKWLSKEIYETSRNKTL